MGVTEEVMQLDAEVTQVTEPTVAVVDEDNTGGSKSTQCSQS